MGPNQESSSIDIACIGPLTASKHIVVQSGVHGVEGFSGSQVQCHWLNKGALPPADSCVIFVHGLNPYGMAWLRRANENNVDLNRNFLRHDEDGRYCNPIYHHLNPILNPRTPPSVDGFLFRCLRPLLRFGFKATKQALAEGQTYYPDGLFYGGSKLQQSLLLYRDWLEVHLAQAQTVTVLDLHTGLGKFGVATVFGEIVNDQKLVHNLNSNLHNVAVLMPQDPDWKYDTKGGVKEIFRSLVGDKALNYLTIEFGTHHTLSILSALRAENRWHYYGDGSITHKSKHRLLAMFHPTSAKWNQAIFANGSRIIQRVVE